VYCVLFYWLTADWAEKIIRVYKVLGQIWIKTFKRDDKWD
jgi:hypothetical protein